MTLKQDLIWYVLEIIFIQDLGVYFSYHTSNNLQLLSIKQKESIIKQYIFFIMKPTASSDYKFITYLTVSVS